MDIEEEIALTLSKHWRDMHTNESLGQQRMLATALMPLVRRAQAETLRDYRTRLLDQNTDRYGIVMPDLYEVLDDLDEEADRIEKGAGE